MCVIVIVPHTMFFTDGQVNVLLALFFLVTGSLH